VRCAVSLKDELDRILTCRRQQLHHCVQSL